MNSLLIGVLSVLVSTNQPTTISNTSTNQIGISASIPNRDDLLERECQKLLEDAAAAQAEVTRWIRENQSAEEKGTALSSAAMNQRVAARFAPIRKAYEDFLQRHPAYTQARLDYASFLSDSHEEDASHDQMEKARELDPKNPAPWNNLANYYGHFGPVKKAFEYYAKAIELDPAEPVYFQNFATTVFLFRRDAKEFYDIDEQKVFDKALELYRKALQLDPTNFALATDVAQTYYGIKPPRTAEAVALWEQTLKIASNELERESVHVHLARINLGVGRFDEARQHLNAITNETYTVIKNRLTRNLIEKETKAKETNAPLGVVPSK
ncbi:MAG: hypothetical protein HY298_13240 [Verrucomicrobia bacterium]|nr:hypothetical protein [Verrucomicrobiota bacterium]